MSDLTLTTAVFASGDQLILIRLEDDDADRAVSDAAARGYHYAGSISVVQGTPKVRIEDGHATAMSHAGVVFASMLGKQLKHYCEVS